VHNCKPYTITVTQLKLREAMPALPIHVK